MSGVAAGMQPEEKALIQRCQKGERDAFDSLFRQYEKRVYNMAFRLCNNYDEAGDVTVDVFLRIFRAIGRFEFKSSFSTWVFRIVTNVYLDRRKRASNRSSLSLEEYIALEETSVTRQLESADPSPAQIAEQNERTDALQHAIAQLPDYQRAMVVLYHTEGLSYEEIAEVLTLPIGTVKSRLNRARLLLRQILQNQQELF